MHRCPLQLKEAESDLPAEHVTQGHNSCRLLTMWSISGDRRVRHQSDNKDLGAGPVARKREQLRWFRYRGVQRPQICSKLRRKSPTTHEICPWIGSTAFHSFAFSRRLFHRPASIWFRWARSTTTLSTSSIGNQIWRLHRTKSAPKL